MATLAGLCLLVGLSGGCLNLSLFNRDASETKARLDVLEHRVSALEAGGVCRSSQPAATTQPASYSAPAPTAR
ncbi:MAG: hypothetical protein ABR915_23235 [Thermoguttaceae bacterium]|jgi:hypothetical protein